MSKKDLENNATNVAVAPVKLLGGVVLEIPDDVEDADDFVKTRVAEKLAALTTSKKARELLFDFSQKLSEIAELPVVLLPLGLMPVTEKEDGEIVNSFMDDFFKYLGEDNDTTSGENA